MQSLLYCSVLFAFAFCAPQRGGSPGAGGRPGGMEHGPHGGPPSYLQGLNKTAVDEYFAIIRNDNETITAQNTDIDTWAAKWGVTAQVTADRANETAFRNELAQNITNLIAQLPSANTALQQIFTNQDQTRAQQRTALEAFKNSTGPAAELLLFMPNVFRPHDHEEGPDGRQEGAGKGGKGGAGKRGQGGASKGMGNRK